MGEAPMICPECEEVLKDGARFCSNCGLSFSSLKTPTEQAETHDLPETLPELDPLVGQVLDGKYELLARLGEGGMGAVYRARRVHIGDEVALKVLLRKFVADAGLVERFRREARAAAALRHPNVVAIYDFGEARDDGAPAYIVMELVEGGSLRQLLRREGCLKPERAVALMRDICAGVGAAHRKQIFHRDLKPDNVIVLPPDEERERETVKVVDFGLAKLRDAAGAPTLTETGAVMGTPHYMSPEQCRGERLDARSDVYSLGAMLYEMLAGSPPFTAPSLAGVLAKHITEAPPPLPADAHVPPALAAVIMHSLAKDPDARPAGATELSLELRAAEEEAARRRDAEVQRRREEKLRQRNEQGAGAAEEEQQREEAEERSSRAAEAKRKQAERRTRGDDSESSLADEVARIMANRPTEAFDSVLRSPSVETLARRSAAPPKRAWRAAIIAGAALVLVAVAVAPVMWLRQTVVMQRQAPVSETKAGQLPSKAVDKPQTMTNRVGMEFVWIPPGSFMMGSSEDDLQRAYEQLRPYYGKDAKTLFSSETPAHRVTISEGFYMDKYEVTQAQWQAVMGNNPSHFRGDNLPVEEVSWNDAQEFVQKLNAQNDGFTYRLPSEAEWEYACRAGTTTEFAFGSSLSSEQANFPGDRPYFRGGAPKGVYRHKTTPVGNFQPNAFGLYDMHGNVWEWCQDWYHESYGGAPTDGSAWLTGGEKKYRVARGGAWNYDVIMLRSAFRGRTAPDARDEIGLRLVAVARL
jgi:formylglycine-generating enzyme required for sulfatase activity